MSRSQIYPTGKRKSQRRTLLGLALSFCLVSMPRLTAHPELAADRGEEEDFTWTPTITSYSDITPSGRAAKADDPFTHSCRSLQARTSPKPHQMCGVTGASSKRPLKKPALRLGWPHCHTSPSDFRDSCLKEFPQGGCRDPLLWLTPFLGGFLSEGSLFICWWMELHSPF